MTPLQRTYAIAQEATDAQQDVIRELQAEIARLQAGGCARDQSTTQFCAEAVALKEQMQHMVRLDDPVVTGLVDCVRYAADVTDFPKDARMFHHIIADYEALVKGVSRE